MPLGTTRRLRVGCQFDYGSDEPVPMLMLVRARTDGAHRTLHESRWVDPYRPIREYFDGYGNGCWRFVTPAGPLRLRYDAVVEVEDEPDPVAPEAQIVPVDLCLLRLLGVPARYVSGHLLGQGAPHAWVEALVDDPAAAGGTDVVGYDPTHRRRTTLGFITVAVGRDFADVTPTSGYFTGPAIGRLSSSKQAEIVPSEDPTTGAPATS
ncbi:MAG TPA: transglutaminase family protein [Chloroflexota bacterium]